MTSAALTLGGGPASAAAECIAEPNHDPPDGMHWYYRYDRVNDRRCWYLRTLITPSEAPATEPPRAVMRSMPAVEAPRAARSMPAEEQPHTVKRLAPVEEPPRATYRPASLPDAQRRRPPLSESEEAALYLEFLRWREQQKAAQ
jgi:hypothetical protein